MRLLIFLIFNYALFNVESKRVIQQIVLEPIFRFADTNASPMKSVFFIKLSQSDVLNNIDFNSQSFNAVRGFTMEMFLKDLNCSVDSCQNFPQKVRAVYHVIDREGRSKFEISPASTDKLVAKSGYLSTEWMVGLHKYNEYFSEEDNLFAYTNNYFPAQYYGCQYRDHMSIHYKFVRTLGYAFEPISIPTNLPIYSLIETEVEDDVTTPSPYVPKYIKSAPIDLFRPAGTRPQTKFSVGGDLKIVPQSQSVARVNQTKACAFSSQIVLQELEKCGKITTIFQWVNQEQGFLRLSTDIAMIVPTTPVTWLGKFGYAFESNDDNKCDFPLVPLGKWKILMLE
ncbi:DUF1968 domain-containing protein [Caenorhabditis elegans]|uniref:DUF1968 domain-containing protein n=1 Tax=Caenorhabditis elegans TaxID=6239 RepID=Q20549_CAEEL|nr:DUF1968 domain-containing protein [Caenorhabditis elegans]CAA98483.2 DUF1968 domain-containing protein [Caenorhabditis elegans]|eukprot:NP_001335507.1 Uncharacterized protein CELE_F47G9.6 [Caenorhabditis elegans]